MTLAIDASAEPTAAAPAAPTTRSKPAEYLSFRLGREEYGIDILQVQEIRSYENPTKIANAPAHIRGVVNLRGVIVPIVDLRIRLGCERAEFDSFTVVIVLTVGARVVGVVVDSVSDLVELKSDDIRSAPAMTCTLDSRFIAGLGTVTTGEVERMLILMDIRTLLDDADTALVVER